MLHVLRSWLAGATELHDISWWMVARRQQSRRLKSFAFVWNEAQPSQWQYKLPPYYVLSTIKERWLFSAHWFSISATSLLKAADHQPPTLGQFRLQNWDPARSASRKKRDFHPALAIDKMDQIPWAFCQTLPKAHCLHLIGADALEEAGESTSHSRAPGWAGFWRFWPWIYSAFVGL